MINWSLPASPLDCTEPPPPRTEADKFANNAKYMAQKARYILATKWNQPIKKFFNDSTMDDAGNDVRIVDFMMKCFEYYYGEQTPDVFNYSTEIAKGATTTSPILAGQNIRPLADFMIGNVIQTIKPMRRSITALALDKNLVGIKNDYFNMLKLKNAIADKLQALSGVVSVNPPNPEHEGLTDNQEIADAKEAFKGEYEMGCINIAKSTYFSEDLHNKFIELASQQIIGGLCQMIITGEHGDVKARINNAWTAIHDESASDIFGSDARVGGGVRFFTAQQIISMHPEMDETNREFLLGLCKPENRHIVNYINESGEGNRTRWVDGDLISYAEVYWIELRDTRIKTKDVKYVGDEYYFIKDEADYQYVDEQGKVITLKGEDIKGKEIFDVHKVILVANSRCIAAGYADYVVRPANDKAMPQLPIVSLCHGLRFGYFKSMVGRLIPLQGELDYVSKKIRDTMARDKGKSYLIDGSKLTAKAKKLLEDLESMNLHVTNSASGEVDNPNENRPLVSTVDFSLDQSIGQYLSIKQQLVAEMEALVSIPAVALGQQKGLIGKGVQENTITQATLGQMSIYEAINEFYRKVLQRIVHVGQMVYTDGLGEDDVNEKVLPISQSQVEIFKITKDFSACDIGIYLMANDNIDSDKMIMLKSFIQAMSQNIQYLKEWGMLPDDVLALMRIETFAEGMEYIEKARRRNMKIIAQEKQATSENEMQMQGQLKNMEMQFQKEMQLMKEENANYRAEVAALSKYLDQLLKEMQADPAQNQVAQNNQAAAQQQQQAPQLA